jgi:hypothetical protein
MSTRLADIVSVGTKSDWFRKFRDWICHFRSLMTKLRPIVRRCIWLFVPYLEMEGVVCTGWDSVRGAWAERRHRAPPSWRRRLGSVPSVVPTDDADAGDVRACYPTTATCPGPRQGPAGRDLPGAPRPDHWHSCDNPPGKIPYYRLRSIHFNH